MRKDLMLSNSDRWLTFLSALCMAPGIALIMRAIGHRIPTLGDLADAMDIIFICIVLAFSLPAISRKCYKADFLLYFLILSIYVLNMFIFPENNKYLSTFFARTMLGTVPMLFIGSMWNIKKYDAFLHYFSVFGILWLTFYFLFYYSGDYSEEYENSNMAAAYEVLFLLLFEIWYISRRFNVLSIPVIIIGFFALISFGSRGPFICFFLFLFLYLIFFSKFKYKKYVVSAFILFVVGFSFYYVEIIKILLNFLADKGQSTRIVDTLLMGDVQNESVFEREWIYNTITGRLHSGSQIAYGLFGTWNYTGGYAHRLDLDLFFNFGYIIGSAIILLLIWIYFWAYKACKTVEEKQFLILLMSVGLFPLLFSSYYLFHGNFWLLLGFCLQKIRNRNKVIA